MATASCGEDEFGNLYADVHTEDVNALRGFGSVYWSYDDESDTSAGTPSKNALPGAVTTQCCADATKEQCHQADVRAHSKFEASGHLLDADCIGEDGAAPFMHSKTSRTYIGVSSALYASNQNHLTETADREHYLRNAGGTVSGAEDIDTESDDDLHIVLNPLQEVINEGSGEDSEDREDFVILASNEAVNDREWQEESSVPIEDKVQAILVGGEKPGTPGDEKGQNGKSPGVHPRIGYGGQDYHRHYRYVRGSGPGRLGAISSVNARVAYCKSNNGKADRLGCGRGITNGQRVSLSSRGTGAIRGFSCGLDYSIPSNRTVFDVDIDALKEKPWRLPHVDVSDYFNFGLDEISWMKYCKQMAQFCSEFATQSKISVYEGGRAGQSTTRAIQTGGGCERRSSSDVQGQQIRESDAIFLIDVKEENLSKSCSEDHLVDAGEVNKFLHIGSPKNDLALRSETGVRKKAQPFIEEAKRASENRTDGVLKECLGNEIKDNGDVAIFPRPKTPSPSTPPERIPMQDKRETGEKSWSSSLNDGSPISKEEYVFGTLRRHDVQKKQNLQLCDYVETCEVDGPLKFCADNRLSQKLDVKPGSSHSVAAHVSKKRRLGLYKVNHSCQHSSQVVKKLSSVHTSPAVLGSVGAESMHKKGHISRNNAAEHLNGKQSPCDYANRSNGQHVAEKAERQTKSVCLKVDSKKSKGKGKTDSSKVRDPSWGVPHESAEEKSKASLKVKKCRKGHKCKEKTKSKVKMHLPGCRNLENGNAEGVDKSLFNPNQGTGDMSMISFVSKDNCFFWKKVESMCLSDIQDQDAENVSLLWQCHETEQRTEEKRTIHIGDGGDTQIKKKSLKLPKKLSAHGNYTGNGGDTQIKRKSLKLPKKLSADGNYTGTRRDNHTLKRQVVNSWNALRVLSGKKEEVKHMLVGEVGLASSRTGLLAGSTCEAHVRDSIQIALNKEVSTRHKRKHLEKKERQLICKQPQLELEDTAQGFTNLELSRGHRRKKHHSKKSCKLSCRESNQPMAACLAGQQKQESDTLKTMLVEDIELIVKNDGSSPLIDARVVNSSGKSKKSDSELHRSEIHSTKACNSRLPNVCTNTVSDTGCIALDTRRLQENHPAAESLFVEQEIVNAAVSESSQEEKQRGRSKFERWTSHSEQGRHDSCFSLSDPQNDGRISLSRKVPASKLGQCLRQQDGLAFQLTMDRDNFGGRCLQAGAGKKWKVPRKHKGKMKAIFNEEAGNLSNRGDEEQNVQQDLDQFVAKLEKRRERFKLAMVEERATSEWTGIKDLPLTDRVVDVKVGRPARKRCWGGG